MTRRQILRSLAAAALAAVAPIPAIAATETGIIDLPADQRGFPALYNIREALEGNTYLGVDRSTGKVIQPPTLKIVKIEPTRLNGHTFQLNVRYQYRNDGDWHAVGE